MIMRSKVIGVFFVLMVGSVSMARAHQPPDPLSGTWKGDWGPSPTDGNAVILELRWDGRMLRGTVNPGPGAIAIEKASFDPTSMKIHLEVSKTSPNFIYVVDGLVEENKMTGTWNRPARKGDFQLAREVKGRKAELEDDSRLPSLVGLKADERKVVEYLLKDWGVDYSLTSVDIAIEALGLRQSDELRFRVGKYIKNHPELHAVIRQWGWQTVVLNPGEKLVARAIINSERDKQPPPSRAELAKEVGISDKETEGAVKMLARYGILKRNKSVGGIGFVASESRYINWQPWLDFQFHRVSLASGRIFNVN